MTTAAGALGALGAAAAMDPPAAASPRATPGPAQCPRFGRFDEHTFATLVHVSEQIIPADGDPGNGDLCAASLVEAIAAGDQGIADLVVAGIAGIDQSSAILFEDSFRNLTFPQQRRVLELLEAGQAPGAFWNSALVRNFTPSPGQPLPPGLRRVARLLHDLAPLAMPLEGAVLGAMAGGAQQAVFASLRTLCKLAFVGNFPEDVTRDPATRLPVFSDPQHLISDPDDGATATGWGIVRYHVVDFEAEKLLWEWQAGRKVVGFNGIPVLGDRELTIAKRTAARDALYVLSLDGAA